MTEHEANLLDALVGEHRELYLTSATFHASIRALADLLPAMVRGLAASASEEQTAIAEAIERTMRSMPLPLSPIPVDPADLETAVVNQNLDTGRVTLNGSPVVADRNVPEGQVRWDSVGERFLTHDGQVPRGHRRE